MTGNNARYGELVCVALLSSLSTLGLVHYIHEGSRMTPTELFDLRSKCSKLAETFIQGETNEDNLAHEVPFYDEANNRCLVNHYAEWKGGISYGGVTWHWLNDAQTGETLARTRAQTSGKWGWITNPKTGVQEVSTYDAAEAFIHERTTEKDATK